MPSAKPASDVAWTANEREEGALVAAVFNQDSRLLTSNSQPADLLADFLTKTRMHPLPSRPKPYGKRHYDAWVGRSPKRNWINSETLE
jgi:hypothetical protein